MSRGPPALCHIGDKANRQHLIHTTRAKELRSPGFTTKNTRTKSPLNPGPPPQTLIHTFIRYHAQIISRMTLFKIGQTVRYARTGTVGKIVSISRDGDADYAELDTTGLLYRTDQLTEIAETAHKAKTERNVRKETAEEAAREQAIRESAWLAVDNSCEGGG